VTSSFFCLQVAGASAEFFGDIALSPFESVKVRIQTSLPGTFPTTLREAAPKVKSRMFSREMDETRFPVPYNFL
jgi:solute carrier family 25 phosphate transporter 3